MADINFGTTPEGPTVTGTEDATFVQGITQQVRPAPVDNSWADSVVAQSRPAPMRLPAHYYPDPTAIASETREPSMFQRITTMMMDAGTQPGQLPVSVRIRLAQAEANQNALSQQIAWQNHLQSREVHRDLLEKQAADNKVKVMEMWPHAQAIMRDEKDLTKRGVLAQDYANLFDSLVPGMGKLPIEFHKEPYYNGMWAAIAGNAEEGSAVRDMVAKKGWVNTISDPEGQRALDIMGHDAAGTVIGHFDRDSRAKLSAGKLGEEEFRQIFKRTMYSPESGLMWKPDLGTAVESFLATAAGEQFMVGSKVETNKIRQHRQEKGSTGGAIQAGKDAKYLARQEIIDESETEAGKLKYNATYINQLKRDQRIAEKLEGMETNVGINPNNRVEQRFRELTEHKYVSSEEIASMPPSPERTTALKAFARASQENDENTAKEAMRQKQEAPVERADLYSRKALRSGKLGSIVTPLTLNESLTNPDIVRVDRKHVDALGKLQIAKSQGIFMYDLADKAYKATTRLGITGQVTTDLLFKNPLSAAVAGVSNPNMKTYHDELTAWSGKDAKALGDEVGVLTDTDRQVWKDTFPVASDTPKIREKKKAIFNKMVDYIYDTNVKILTGELDPSYVTSTANTSKVKGILGSALGLSKEASASPAPSSEPEKPDTRSRAQRLREEMVKGQ